MFAVARDGVLPWSNWISQVDINGQPKHAVTVIYLFGAIIQCTILASQVAFTSLISAGGVPTIAAYGLICLLRFFFTPNNFKNSYFYLGRFRRLFYGIGIFWNGLIVSVRESAFLVLKVQRLKRHTIQVMLSPFVFPLTSETFNFVSAMPP